MEAWRFLTSVLSTAMSCLMVSIGSRSCPSGQWGSSGQSLHPAVVTSFHQWVKSHQIDYCFPCLNIGCPSSTLWSGKSPKYQRHHIPRYRPNPPWFKDRSIPAYIYWKLSGREYRYYALFSATLIFNICARRQHPLPPHAFVWPPLLRWSLRGPGWLDCIDRGSDSVND
jgi:hypothetical protein